MIQPTTFNRAPPFNGIPPFHNMVDHHISNLHSKRMGQPPILRHSQIANCWLICVHTHIIHPHYILSHCIFPCGGFLKQGSLLSHPKLDQFGIETHGSHGFGIPPFWETSLWVWVKNEAVWNHRFRLCLTLPIL